VTAVFHHLAPYAKVVGIEHIREIAEWSKENLRKDGVKVGEGGVGIVHGDGRLGELSVTICSTGLAADVKDRPAMVCHFHDVAYESSIPNHTRRSCSA
jgi:protein-L-isoaspartate O-methyltransferase